MATAKPKVKKPKKSKVEAQAQAERFKKKVKNRNQIPKGEHHGMKLLLTENVMHLGTQGSIVEVKPGYGRNYLIPQGLATFVNESTLRRIDKHKAAVEAHKMARLAELKVVAKELEKHSTTIEANANEEGHLYGSVTALDIARALQRDKFNVEEKQVKIEGPLKELGLYNVRVHIAEEVEAEVKVWVVPSKAAET